MLLIFIVILLKSLATIFAKKVAICSVGGGLDTILLNGWFLAEIIALILQAVVWSYALKRVPLSKAYPCMSLVFVLNLFAAWYIFNESVKINHVAGIIVIILGVIILRDSSDTKFCSCSLNTTQMK